MTPQRLVATLVSLCILGPTLAACSPTGASSKGAIPGDKVPLGVAKPLVSQPISLTNACLVSSEGTDSTAGIYPAGSTAMYTGNTGIDCYLPHYNGTVNQDIQVGFADFEDLGYNEADADNGGANASCGPISFSYGILSGNAANVSTVAPPEIDTCPMEAPSANPGAATVRFTAQVNADPKAGPSLVVLQYVANFAVNDPSDSANGQTPPTPNQGVVYIFLHIGMCQPANDDSEAKLRSPKERSAKLIASIVQSHKGRPESALRAGVRRPMTGGSAGGNGPGSPYAADYLDFEPVTGGTPDSCALPAPLAAKSLYSASLQSAPQIALTDAADPSHGTLTWNYDSESSQLGAVSFTQNTSGYPYANTLTMTVSPTATPGSYPVNLSVTDSNGVVSPVTTITIQILSPVAYLTDDNAGQVFSESSGGAVVVDGATNFATNESNITPDFPIATSGAASSSARKPAQYKASGPYNPFSPPATIVQKLGAISAFGKSACLAVLVDTSKHDDRTDGSKDNTGEFQYFAYCNWAVGAAPIGIVQYQQSSTLNVSSTVISPKTSNIPLHNSVGNYNAVFYILASDPFLATPLSGHAEKMSVSYALVFVFLEADPQVRLSINNVYFVNDKGVFYPKIAAAPSAGASDDGFVPWNPLNETLIDCPKGSTSSGCTARTKASDKLGKELVKAGKADPGSGYEAHHVLPIRFGGDNRAGNGVWLSEEDHDQFSAWFNVNSFHF